MCYQYNSNKQDADVMTIHLQFSELFLLELNLNVQENYKRSLSLLVTIGTAVACDPCPRAPAVI